MDARDNARELFMRYHARYHVSPYFVRTPGNRRIQAGFDLDLYGRAANRGSLLSIGSGDFRATLDGLCAACSEVVAHAPESRRIEIIPFNTALVFDAKSHFEPEALVRVRITHSRGRDQPAGASEEKVLAEVIDRLDALGVKKN